ncbi:hypothetical protein Tdes44962_MAKER08419 [Teratosphaeria destructans]|uniref:Uncharacterized protein n=1 Tax=Teratosphaeria destructans TaxID=418781 RepID=A0A9W7SWQ0_9PEZI|nr:hypothetical protein Tdes44962_MAKER08419 [Teratosphaeria destructans]
MSSWSPEEDRRLRELINCLPSKPPPGGRMRVIVATCVGIEHGRHISAQSAELRYRTLTGGHEPVLCRSDPEKKTPVVVGGSGIPVSAGEHAVEGTRVHPALATIDGPKPRTLPDAPPAPKGTKRKVEPESGPSELIKRPRPTGITSQENLEPKKLNATSLLRPKHSSLKNGAAALALPNTKSGQVDPTKLVKLQSRLKIAQAQFAPCQKPDDGTTTFPPVDTSKPYLQLLMKVPYLELDDEEFRAHHCRKTLRGISIGQANKAWKSIPAFEDDSGDEDKQDDSEGEEELAPASPAMSDNSHKQPPLLPRHPCMLEAPAVRKDSGPLYDLAMDVTVGKTSYAGNCKINKSDIEPSSLQLLEQGKRLEEKFRPCEACFVEIHSEEDDEDGEDSPYFVVSTEVYWRGIVVPGYTRISKTDIDINLLNHYDVVIGQRLPVQESVEIPSKHELRVEEANQRNRTVVILGQLPIGERKRLDVAVEVWSWDGSTSMECRARIMERRASAGGFHVALRVKMAEGMFIHLRGWMHAGTSGGRFAEEFPGETFVD